MDNIVNNINRHGYYKQPKGGLGRFFLFCLTAGVLYLGGDAIFSHINKNQDVPSDPITTEEIITENPTKIDPEIKIGYGLENIDDGYIISIEEKTADKPYLLSPDMLRLVEDVKGIKNDYKKAEKLYRIVDSNVKYGENKRINGYRNSVEVLETAEGVCGESTILYITLARLCGLKANYVSVDIDFSGDDVNHACAGVQLQDKGFVLVDNAYSGGFDIKHKDFTVRSDEEFERIFSMWRN
ncbi:MAG: transglutaminase-like domain-containing protein [Nanoarchaeota archaeon]|nr:transglutaminase-like domain-containing protein [Nanoarchaeota archaeon]